MAHPRHDTQHKKSITLIRQENNNLSTSILKNSNRSEFDLAKKEAKT